MKREPLILVAAAALGAAFLAVSLLVWLTRGHPWLIARKLRLGALLLGLTSTAAGCGQATCYDPAPTDDICLVDEAGSCRYDDLTVPQDGSATFSGKIFLRQASAFAYRITDGSRQAEITGDIAALDGAFDESEEEFEIVVDGTKLAPGVHLLQLFNRSTDEVASGSAAPYREINLTVK